MNAIILAGGKSSRMGSPKAFLEVGGRQIIQRVLDTVVPLFSKVILVTNNPEAYAYLGMPMVNDTTKGRGPLGGLEAGLAVSGEGRNFVVACDMPFLDEKIITALIHQAAMYPETEIMVPKWQRGIEPLHAVYDRRVLQKVKECLSRGDTRIKACFEGTALRYFDLAGWDQDELEKAFFNINVPEDLAQAEEWARDAGESGNFDRRQGWER